MNKQNSELKKAGLKATLPRIKIMEILESTAIQEEAHFSAEDIYKELLQKGENIGLALQKLTNCDRLEINERISNMLEINIEKEMEKIEKSYTFLATVGSTAPFIGLFGTVWGIMNSFQSIAISRNTSLAIVAPGIAEALFATALGLLAAIPAVIAFNKFNSDSKKYTQKLNNFSKRLLSII